MELTGSMHPFVWKETWYGRKNLPWLSKAAQCTNGLAKMSIEVEYLPPQEIVIREFNSLRGRLLSVIEAMNLAPGQERAIKQLIRQASFQQQKTVAELVEKLNADDARFRYSREYLTEA